MREDSNSPSESVGPIVGGPIVPRSPFWGLLSTQTGFDTGVSKLLFSLGPHNLAGGTENHVT